MYRLGFVVGVLVMSAVTIACLVVMGYAVHTLYEEITQ